eukprot:COSAG01_NODE_476_length_16515_cov_37.730690_9_plen_51_part_00
MRQDGVALNERTFELLMAAVLRAPAPDGGERGAPGQPPPQVPGPFVVVFV